MFFIIFTLTFFKIYLKYKEMLGKYHAELYEYYYHTLKCVDCGKLLSLRSRKGQNSHHGIMVMEHVTTYVLIIIRKGQCRLIKIG